LLKGDDEKLEELRKRLDRLVQDSTSLVIEQVNNSVLRIGDQTAKTGAKVDELESTATKIVVGVDDIRNGNNAIMDLLLEQHSTSQEDNIYDVMKPA
jgi:archaellum component FlaC